MTLSSGGSLFHVFWRFTLNQSLENGIVIRYILKADERI